VDIAEIVENVVYDIWYYSTLIKNRLSKKDSVDKYSENHIATWLDEFRSGKIVYCKKLNDDEYIFVYPDDTFNLIRIKYANYLLAICSIDNKNRSHLIYDKNKDANVYGGNIKPKVDCDKWEQK